MKSLLCAAIALASVSTGYGQLIDSYNADTLSSGALSSWTDLTGTNNATVANANSYLTYTNGFGDPTVANSLSAFDGHNYVAFGYSQGLATASSLFSGGNARTIVAVYATPAGDNTAINPIAGETGNGPNVGTWSVLQSRDSGVAGNPYFAGYADDVGSGTDPVANQLTFAVITYSAATGENLYWAYGTGGSVGTAANSAAVLNTGANPFTIGADKFEGPLTDMDIGTVQVYDTALTAAQVDAEIADLQTFYELPVPEPATDALMIGTLVCGGLVLARRRIA